MRQVAGVAAIRADDAALNWLVYWLQNKETYLDTVMSNANIGKRQFPGVIWITVRVVDGHGFSLGVKETAGQGLASWNWQLEDGIEQKKQYTKVKN